MKLAEVKTILDVAKAAKTYARAAKLGREARQYAEEVKLNAERRLGVMLQETGRATGTRSLRVSER